MTTFTLAAAGWTDASTTGALQYSFYYSSSLSGCGVVAGVQYPLVGSLTISNAQVTLPSGNLTITAYVLEPVSGAQTTVTATVVVAPNSITTMLNALQVCVYEFVCLFHRILQSQLIVAETSGEWSQALLLTRYLANVLNGYCGPVTETSFASLRSSLIQVIVTSLCSNPILLPSDLEQLGAALNAVTQISGLCHSVFLCISLCVSLSLCLRVFMGVGTQE